eukprot:TRINITY_DN3736_c0_g1_i1.p1 TRINITY_DN3736_c0_g1~~TRINITY_DN3736_c0_g1_i1.p1  ORF type:complete len:151 (+),score=53.50 TRINITY_DN3736_c0_g1_i1:205-657(+)
MKGGKMKNEASSTLKKVDDRKITKRKGGEKKAANKRAKKEKDPNKPKRPPSAFFVFMEEFRKTFKEKNPNNKSVAAVGKAGGDKWKSMSEAEKAPYVQKAAKRKTDYEKNMAAYNKKQAGVADDAEESDKSKSEVNDEEEEESGEEEEED